jgi:hypothetical protein
VSWAARIHIDQTDDRNSGYLKPEDIGVRQSFGRLDAGRYTV